MSNKFTYHPTSQKPPPVCKKSIPDALLGYTCPPDLMQAMIAWDTESAYGGFEADGTDTYTPGEQPGWYHATIGDPNADHIEATLIMENECEEYSLIMFAYGGEDIFDVAWIDPKPWRETKPWDTGLEKAETSGGGQAPSHRATS